MGSLRRDILILLFFSVACNSKLPIKDLVRFVKQPENGLVQSKSYRAFNYKVEYKPYELVALEAIPTSNLNSKKFKNIAEEYSKLEYYQIIISSQNNMDFLKADLSDDSEFESRVNYYTSQAQKDIRLLIEGDSISCLAYHFERTFGLTPYNTILIAFDNSYIKKHPSNRTIIFNDKALKTGWLKFNFKHGDIQSTPQIQL